MLDVGRWQLPISRNPSLSIESGSYLLPPFPSLPMGPYEEILQALANENIEFIVGGGVAGVLHGVERVTMDLDVAVHMRSENLNPFLRVMKRLRLSPRVPIRPEALLDPKIIQMLITENHALVFSFVDPDRPIRHLDLFLKAELSYDSLLPDSEWIPFGPNRIRIINRKRLLAIKRSIQPPRAKDVLDIEFLSREG